MVHLYAGVMVVGLAATSWFFVAPPPAATLVESTTGEYTVRAAPGMGYAFKWDCGGPCSYADGTNKGDTSDFGEKDAVKISLEPGKSQVVRLEVKNVFGWRASKEFPLSREQSPTVLEVGQN